MITAALNCYGAVYFADCRVVLASTTNDASKLSKQMIGKKRSDNPRMPLPMLVPRNIHREQTRKMMETDTRV